MVFSTNVNSHQGHGAGELTRAACEAALRRIPTTPEDLTPGWLTAVLRSSGLDVDVASLEIEVFAEGAGMMSLLVRARPTYARTDGPASVIVKMATPNAANRATAIAFHNYRREVLFYRVAAARTPTRLPVIYHEDVAGDAPFILVMEDLASYQGGDQVVGATIDQARLGMTALADLHASFWNDVDRPELDFIPYHYPSYHSDALQQAAVGAWDDLATRAGEALPDWVAGLKSRFLPAIPRMQEWITDHPRTVVHGDFRMDNLFFGRTPAAGADGGRGLAGNPALQGRPRRRQVSSARACPPRSDERTSASSSPSGTPDSSPMVCLATPRSRRGRTIGVRCSTCGRTWSSPRECWIPHNDRGRRWMTEMARRSAAAFDDLGLIELLEEFE